MLDGAQASLRLCASGHDICDAQRPSRLADWSRTTDRPRECKLTGEGQDPEVALRVREEAAAQCLAIWQLGGHMVWDAWLCGIPVVVSVSATTTCAC